MLFLYIKIPALLHASDRFRHLEEEIDRMLGEKGIGSVAGWGGSLGAALADGSRPIGFTRIDVDVSDIAAATAILRTSLPTLGAPPGTEIYYTVERRNRKDVYAESGWVLDLPGLDAQQ